MDMHVQELIIGWSMLPSGSGWSASTFPWLSTACEVVLTCP